MKTQDSGAGELTHLDGAGIAARSNALVVARWEQAARVGTGFAMLVATVVFVAHYFSGLGARLPNGWEVMTAETALAIIMGATGSALRYRPQSGARSRMGARVSIVLMGLLGASALLSSAIPAVPRLGPLLTLTPAESAMSVQTACAMVLLAIAMYPGSGRLGKLPAIAVAACCLLILTVVCGYIFQVAVLVGLTDTLRMSPHTLLCVAALLVAAVGFHVETPPLSALFSVGTGGAFCAQSAAQVHRHAHLFRRPRLERD